MCPEIYLSYIERHTYKHKNRTAVQTAVGMNKEVNSNRNPNRNPNPNLISFPLAVYGCKSDIVNKLKNTEIYIVIYKECINYLLLILYSSTPLPEPSFLYHHKLGCF